MLETSLGKIASISKHKASTIMVPCVEPQHLAGSRAQAVGSGASG